MNFEQVLPATGDTPGRAHFGHPTVERWLYTTEVTRTLESVASTHDNRPLMQIAGEACARLALALFPHAQVFWIACGNGNNGGDGMQAAAFLQRWGKQAVVSLLPDSKPPSADAQAARASAEAAGVEWTASVPSHFDVCIDALVGIGMLRPWGLEHAQWIEVINASAKPVLSIDLPSGLAADTGMATPLHVHATHTLSLLTLKPGLFMTHGRDACGDIWFHDLGVPRDPSLACAQLSRPEPLTPKHHASHKGSFGDVCVVGGAQGMEGAALLAASAALHGGAGRVYLHMLGQQENPAIGSMPELMVRDLATLDLSHMTVVAGCGGGSAIALVLERLLQHAERLVLDADALNVIAQQPGLQTLLSQRREGSTVITPHPLEAARLLEGSTTQVQAHRLAALDALTQRLRCTVVLKGSGTLIGQPGTLPFLNTTGNGILASPGTGDVLAGLIAAYWAGGRSALQAALQAVYRHGQVADQWASCSAMSTLTAKGLAEAV